MNEHPGGGLMQALAPIARHRPIHLIVSAADGDALHVVCQPVRIEKDEDPEVGRGFSVEATPAELDTDLPALVADRWVPARESLEKVLGEVTAAAERAKLDAARRKEGKGKDGKGKQGAADSAQTTIIPPAPSAGVQAARAADGTVTSTDPAPDMASSETEPVLPAPVSPPATPPETDGISALFS